jgi:hypothetical protein
MDRSVRQLLESIGEQLDRDEYPHVFNDGVIAPAGSVIDDQLAGVETNHESRPAYRSAAGSRQGATGWQRQAGESGPSSPTTPSGCGRLQSHYLEQLDGVVAAYPQTTFLLQNNGLWLWVEGAVLPDLTRRATFLIAVPFSRGCKVQAWAFWSTALGHQWIGPRHTNAVDGSICAFNPIDRTWKEGGQLTALMDLYSLWAFRQLHVEVLGWWPGRQTAQFAYERLTECNDNEWCGCRPDAPRYADCCKDADLKADRSEIMKEFIGGFLKFRPRKPPPSIVSVLTSNAVPPEIRRYTLGQSLAMTSNLRGIRHFAVN